MFKQVKRFIGKAYKTTKQLFSTYKKGLVQTIADSAREVRKTYPPSIQNILKECGNDVVSNIRVCRELVSKNTESLLQFISLGKWEEAKKKYGYDRFFHLFMLFDAGGKTYMIEKNQVINLTHHTKRCDEGMPVSSGGFTLQEMLDKTRKSIGDEKFFTYDPLENNCQNFLIAILRANGVLTEEIRKFVHQDIKSIVSELPSYVKPLAKGLTDVAAVIDTAIQKSTINTDG